MKLRYKEVTVGETTFVVHVIPPFQALAVLGDLQKELAPVLGALASGVEGKDVDFGEVAEMIAPRLSGDKLLFWADKLLRPEYVSVSMNGNTVPLDANTRELAFTDAIQILQLMWELISFNFAAPLQTFASRFGPKMAALTKAKSQ